MYPVRPPKIYVHERVHTSPACVARLERMLAAIDYQPEPEVVDDERLNAIAEAAGWSSMGSRRTGEFGRTGDPTLIFNAFTWPSPDELAARRERFPHLRGHYFLGDGAITFRNGRATRETQLGVCQNGYELHSAWGCLHYCDYCNIGQFLHILLNIEDIVARLPDALAANPWCQLYKYDNHTDIPAFEPEYDATRPLVDFFARQPQQFLMLYTKSDNVAYLTDLDHRRHTLVCWTLSPESVAREIEKGAPSTSARIGAIRTCQQAGYPVRVRFSPIIPTQGWRDESVRMLDELFAAAEIDLVTMDMFKWIEPRRVGDIFDVSLWDPEFLAHIDRYAAMEPAERPRPILPNGKQVFPHDARLGVYRFFLDEIRTRSPGTRVALCGETPEMWHALGPTLGMTPDHYVCACGPTAVPGNPLLPTIG